MLKKPISITMEARLLETKTVVVSLQEFSREIMRDEVLSCERKTI
jgi:hypothetical protein